MTVGCCDPRGYDRVFTAATARSSAERYRRRGLDRTARGMVAALRRDGLRGATVLEIGGGIGGIQLELLRAGAASAVNLELSPAYDGEAHRLLADAGLSGRVTRRLVDIVTAPDGVAAADLVVLHRVVCCYPDHARLLAAAAAHARDRLVVSFPRCSPAVRAAFAAENLTHRLRGRDFRVFVHRPEAMIEVLTRAGLELRTLSGGPVWRYALATRRGARPRDGAEPAEDSGSHDPESGTFVPPRSPPAPER